LAAFLWEERRCTGCDFQVSGARFTAGKAP
jgi:hypothetical protein